MSITKLVISDLHLADGHPILDEFDELQQSAFEGLLLAASVNGPLGQAADVELIINGDCFDFLAMPPYTTYGTTNSALAVEKLAKITAAHRPFFEALRHFCAFPGRRVTFLTGNHDIELQFEAVRKQISEVIDTTEKANILFCPTRFYRPLPDVYIEHGNHYDFWNHRSKGLWDEQGEPLTLDAEATITLPPGSWYYQETGVHVSKRYPYFDHMEPTMSNTRQIALLSLLNPDIVHASARRLMTILSQPQQALNNLPPEEERIPARLFEHAMLDFLAFQQDIQSRETDWSEPEGYDSERAQTDTFMEFVSLRETLTNTPLLEAVAAICTPTLYQMGEGVATGMRAVLKNDPTLRYAIAGHTHSTRINPTNEGTQVYLNTGTWTTRVAMPTPGEITPALIEWLREPDWKHHPLRNVTQLTFVLINATADGPSSASLCFWEGGLKGTYRVLA